MNQDKTHHYPQSKKVNGHRRQTDKFKEGAAGKFKVVLKGACKDET